LGTVTSLAAQATNLRKGTPVIMGGHDHHCAFLAAGALLDDHIFDSSGTAESVMTLMSPRHNPPETFKGHRVGCFIDPDRYATMAGILASGASVDWAIKTLWQGAGNGQINGGTSIYEDAMAAAGSVSPGSQGLLYLPHLRGAGGPYWNPGSRGAFVGLRDSHTVSHLMRAVLEGLSLELRVILSSIEEALGTRPTELNTVGGGARNTVWQQIKANITGLPVNVPNVSDATAQGAALLAGIGIGLYADMLDASKQTFRIQTRYEPDPQSLQFYDELYCSYSKLYPQLIQINAELTDAY